MKRYLALMASTLFLAACSDNDEEVFVERSADDLYNEASDLYAKGSYSRSAKIFTEVERQHPYSDWALRAQLRAGEAYYQAKKYEDAIETFNVFIQLHPAHDDVVYAHYMIGMSYYEQMPTVERDQQVTEHALKSFETIINRDGTSKYAQDARMKIDLIYDQMAGREMEVGRFYQNEQSFLAAVNRFKGVVDQYQTTSHVPEALHRLVECYLALGILPEARKTAALLSHNYPGSKWYQAAFALMSKYDPEAVS